MENIFKDAYFGKPYKTRDGEKAVFYNHHNGHAREMANYVTMILEGKESIYRWYYDGTAADYQEQLDIVSEWYEENNEEELEGWTGCVEEDGPVVSKNEEFCNDMMGTIKYDSKTADTIRSMFGEWECLRHTFDSIKSPFINYFQNRLFDRYLFRLHNCFKSNIDEIDIFNIDIIYRSAIKYVNDTIQCTRNAFIFNVLNDHLEILERSYDIIKLEVEKFQE